MLTLPYFQPVHDHVVDTMHNLCSGKINSQYFRFPQFFWPNKYLT